MGIDEARLLANVEELRGRITEAARRAGRQPGEITLVAVTKRQSIEATRALVDCGEVDLGENYPQDLWRKAAEMSDLPVRWHLIGHLQSNKARRTLPLVRFIHAVDTLKLLRVLDEIAATLPEGQMPRVCLQANVSREATKHGWGPDDLLADAEAIAACRAVPIVGLMTMAAETDDPDEARPAFAGLRDLRDRLAARTGLPLPELSMGMSGDYEVAVEEGATLVRVGSALFAGVE
jgi:pyridoxal phosphate enzyme (YggS family)